LKALFTEEAIREGIRTLQQFGGIYPSGVVDEATIQVGTFQDSITRVETRTDFFSSAKSKNIEKTSKFFAKLRCPKIFVFAKSFRFRGNFSLNFHQKIVKKFYLN
jgi:hypothetical protein